MNYKFKICKIDQHWMLFKWRDEYPGSWVYLNYYDTFEEARARTANMVDMVTAVWKSITKK